MHILFKYDNEKRGASFLLPYLEGNEFALWCFFCDPFFNVLFHFHVIHLLLSRG